MYELIKISEKCFYIDCPAKVGVVLLDSGEVALIDSGSDRSAAKKIGKTLEEAGFVPGVIFNTHSHADHIGGNSYFESKYGCKIYAPRIEAAFTENTILEPALLYGGRPPRQLLHKFLLAEGSAALPLSDSIMPDDMKIIPLPGHSPEMVGYLTSDGVAFIGDAVAREETLDKYGVGYTYDVSEHLITLSEVAKMKGYIFVPSHADPTDNILPLAEYNIKKTLEVEERILELCADAICFDDLLANLFDAYQMTMTHIQYALIGSTLRGYITHLEAKGRLEAIIENNRLLYRKI